MKPTDKISQEKITLQRMVHLYCSGQKHDTPLCPECQRLLDYALSRLDSCKFGNQKTFCSHCPVHCYRAEERQGIKRVMKYAGPRMLLHDPLLVLKHLLGRS